MTPFDCQWANQARPPIKRDHQTVRDRQLGPRLIKEDEAEKLAGPTTLLEKRARPMPFEGPGRQKLSNFFILSFAHLFWQITKN